jgi:GR25 family glycosyltransferase involved in LPS biosynthesis
MRPQKAYIIRISNEVSRRYAKDAAESCERIGLPYEFFNGIEDKTAYEAWTQCQFPVKMLGVYKTSKVDKAACATVSHAMVWDKIASRKETAVVLEHDAVMLQPVSVDIPDDAIVTLGYKLKNPQGFNHVNAGPPTKLTSIDGHEGAHAYAITWKTATSMLTELNNLGVSLPIDNTFFLKMRKTKVPLLIADPTPAIGWVRESTIWKESSSANYSFIDSFAQNYKDK